MASIDIPISIENLTLPVHEHLLSIYTDVLTAFYRFKVKGDDKKRTQALEDDEWRYQSLPDQIRADKPDRGLSKEELERLVTWKITHQTNRPFLLPQIRKNDPKAVQRCTAEARQILSKPGDGGPSRKDIREALDKVCELTGVGPATGTLVLSVFDNGAVPFFEDELYAWLFPQSKVKLKYSSKEYFEMVDKILEVKLDEKLRSNRRLSMEFEKVAFVCQHWDCISDPERIRLKDLMDRSMHVQDSEEAKESKDVKPEAATKEKVNGRNDKIITRKKRLREATGADQEGIRRSKRTQPRHP